MSNDKARQADTQEKANLINEIEMLHFRFALVSNLFQFSAFHISSLTQFPKGMRNLCTSCDIECIANEAILCVLKMRKKLSIFCYLQHKIHCKLHSWVVDTWNVNKSKKKNEILYSQSRSFHWSTFVYKQSNRFDRRFVFAALFLFWSDEILFLSFTRISRLFASDATRNAFA